MADDKKTSRSEEEEKQAASSQPAPEAGDEVLPNDLAELLRAATDDDLEEADPTAEIQKGNADPASAWLWSPARLYLTALADERLAKVAVWKGIRDATVTRARVKFVGKTRVVHITPCRYTDKGATPISRKKDGSSPHINLIHLLGPAKLTVAKGHKERFDVYYVPADSKLSKGLIIDLSKSQERAKTPVRTYKKKAKPNPDPNANKKGTPDAGTNKTEPEKKPDAE